MLRNANSFMFCLFIKKAILNKTDLIIILAYNEYVILI